MARTSPCDQIFNLRYADDTSLLLPKACRLTSPLSVDRREQYSLESHCSALPLICKLRVAEVDLASEEAKKTRHHCRAKVDGHCLRLSAQTSIAPIASLG